MDPIPRSQKRRKNRDNGLGPDHPRDGPVRVNAKEEPARARPVPVKKALLTVILKANPAWVMHVQYAQWSAAGIAVIPNPTAGADSIVTEGSRPSNYPIVMPEFMKKDLHGFIEHKAK